MAYNIYIVDFCHYQKGVDPQKLIAGGVSAAIVKDGETWVHYKGKNYNYLGEFVEKPAIDDEYYDENMKRLQENSLPCGSYYYYHPSAGNNKQLNHWKSLWERHEHNFPPILDCEDHDGITNKNEVARQIRVMLEGMAKFSGRQPIVYTRSGWWNYYAGDPDFGRDYMFWLAQYSTKFTLRGTEKIKNNVIMWQFTDRAKIPGCPTMDGNWWTKSEEEFYELTHKFEDGVPHQVQYIEANRVKKNIFALSRANRRWLENVMK